MINMALEDFEGNVEQDLGRIDESDKETFVAVVDCSLSFEIEGLTYKEAYNRAYGKVKRIQDNIDEPQGCNLEVFRGDINLQEP